MLADKSIERVQLEVIVNKKDNESEEILEKKKRIDIQLSELKM